MEERRDAMTDWEREKIERTKKFEWFCFICEVCKIFVETCGWKIEGRTKKKKREGSGSKTMKGKKRILILK
jgi:hypothetical protein